MQVEGPSKEKKIIQVSSSALVGLKAALYSKQQAVKKEKTSTFLEDNALTRKVSEKTASIWKRPNKKVKGQKPLNNHGGQSKESNEKVLSQQEERELEKSRLALEAKAALYDRLSKGQGLQEVEGQEGEESRYMVDFTKKIYDELQEDRSADSANTRNSPQQETAHESPLGDSPPPDRSQGSEEWVEYEDAFGRTRRCLRSELPDTVDKERLKEERSPSPQLLSEDMRRERERVRWEKQVEQELDLDKPVGPVHYQSVRDGEVRSHGVGYYQFSESEGERKQQMEMLDKLRAETSTERDKKQRMQEKRRALLEARLAKVRERRNKQRKADGIADFDFESEESEVKKEEPAEVNRNDIRALLDAELEKSKEQYKLELERKEEEKRAKHRRPWDRGKVDPIRKRKQELEDERPTEFAPPPNYSTDDGAKKTKTDEDHVTLTRTTETMSSPSVVTPPPSSHSNAAQPWFGATPPSSHGNPPGSHGNPAPPWLVNPPPYFMAPPLPPFPWYMPPPPMPWGQYHPPPSQPTPASQPPQPATTSSGQ